MLIFTTCLLDLRVHRSGPLDVMAFWSASVLGLADNTIHPIIFFELLSPFHVATLGLKTEETESSKLSKILNFRLMLSSAQ
jgi:hypothetical protein